MTNVLMTVWVWRAVYASVVAGFLLTVASYYDRTTGLTIFLGLPANSHSYELPVVQAVPHAHDEVDGGYDGQFYAQMAIEPLLRNPDIDRAMDKPGYRAHRILLSWTAWVASRGDPEAALHVFAWQNVIFWLVLAWLMTKWCPPGDARMFVLWAGVLLTHGLLMSVRNALSDGPSVVITALAVLSMERGRPWLAAVITGVSGLARETNILAGAMWLQRLTRHPRSWIVVGAGLLVCLVPLVVWLDYLRSLYLDAAFSGGSHITTPLSGLAWKVRMTWGALQAQGLTVQTTANVFMLMAFVSQAAALLWCTRQWWRDRTASAAWLLVAWPFLLLGLTAHQVVWDGSPGAITRVVLPLTVGVNVLLARQPRASWTLLIAANLGVICGLMAFVYGWI
jgi:hypothetical protein